TAGAPLQRYGPVHDRKGAVELRSKSREIVALWLRRQRRRVHKMAALCGGAATFYFLIRLFCPCSISLLALETLFLIRTAVSFVFRNLRIGKQRAGADHLAARVAFFGEKFVGGLAFFDPADDGSVEAGGACAWSAEADGNAEVMHPRFGHRIKYLSCATVSPMSW